MSKTYPPPKNLTNKRYGKTLVLKRDDRWICRCDCGAIFTASGDRLRSGKVNACFECRQSGNYRHLTPNEVSDRIREGFDSSKVEGECIVCGEKFIGTKNRKLCGKPECAKTRAAQLRQLYKELRATYNIK
jgi:hypothetical protein